MPPRIVDRLADGERRLLHIRPHLGAMAAVDQHFQRHTQFAAIVQDRAVLAGNPRRARVEVMPRVECGGLHAAVLVVHAVAVADRPGTAAHPLTGLQHVHVEPGAGQFQRRHQPRDSGPQYQHASALPQAALEFQRLRATV